MSYSKKVQKAKANRSDHRKARAVAGSVNRISLKRDSKKFKSLEREHDQNQRFGGSLKAVYFDSDGDGYKDTYGRVYRSGVVGKPGAEIPTFGPSNPPVSGPTGLDASVNIPNSGPTGLDASVNIPNSGPTGLDATVNIPNSGPTGLDASVNIPNAGPTGLDATVNAPANGPTDLFAGAAAPANGPTGLDATVNAPANGPTGLVAAKLTLNINIEASQDTIVAKTPEIGTIEYASDFGYLFIYDGTDWHHINGA